MGSAAEPETMSRSGRTPSRKAEFALIGRLVEMGDEPVIDGGDRHEQGEVAGGEPVDNLVGIERRAACRSEHHSTGRNR